MFSYPDWINKGRRDVLKFVERMGMRGNAGETLSGLIERAEREQWAKDLDVDMDKVFMCQEMKKIMLQLASMEQRLENLQKACDKRSGQVIAPSWEPTNAV